MLQCIESALDTKQIVVSSHHDRKEEPRPMHPNFRLFATQNPASGFFKGKRETLSLSFLDRFNPMQVCNALPS